MRTYFFLLTTLGLLLSAVLDSHAADTPDRSLEGHFRVGVILPLSGPLAEYGVAFKNGVNMAIDDQPGLFRNVLLRYEDSQYDAKTAVSALEKLRREGVRMVFVWGNAPSEAVCPLTERYSIPTIASISNPEVSQKKQYIIRAVNHSAPLSRLQVAYLREKRFQRIGMVLTEISYLNSLVSDLRAELASDQSLEIVDTYGPSDNDFRTSVTKIRSGKYDAVGVFLMSGQIAQFYRQAAAQRLNVPTFGTDFFESATEVSQANGAMEGAVYAHFDVNDDFRNRYFRRFGNDIQLAYAGNGYDMITLIARTAQRLPQSPSEIMDSLRLKEPHLGVEGTFRYMETDEGGAYFEFPIHIKQIRGKEFVVIKTE